MERSNDPLVSIGVPVFNGERGLGPALDSLLTQTYSNLEIIVSDNGSTDRTPDICKSYAANEPRVKWFRSEKNCGASWNFNRVFEMSGGVYFMWAAHDDYRNPSFVRACVEALERCPDAVLCQAKTAVSIAGGNETMYVVDLDSFDGKHQLIERYRETLQRFPATAIYGVYRASAMRQTLMFQTEIATDIAFIQELAIYGRFIQVSEVLFHYRARDKWNSLQDDMRHFLGSSAKPWWYKPFAALFVAHCRRVFRAELPLNQKLLLMLVLVGHHLRELALKVCLKLMKFLLPETRKEEVGQLFYWHWMHNPNIKVRHQELFFRRVCKPRLGWWQENS